MTARLAAVPRLLAVPALAVLLAGCGIRATEVPTNFGPAPSRVQCSLAEPDVSTQAARGLPVQVFLLCGSSLVTVDRTVRVPDGAADSERRILVAQGLLDQLAAPTSAAEKEAGYSTDVRGGITVGGPRPGDPDDTLRLSTAPAGLTSYALAQVVCTFSDSAAAEGDGSVVLGGPGAESPRRYECTDEVRARPGSTEPPSKDAAGE
ncbi:lipoprotein [Streptomyces massasporeus]|nr:lipoprotein [Streptomyces massasporeus]